MFIIGYGNFCGENTPENGMYRSYVGHNPKILYEYNMKRPDSVIDRYLGLHSEQLEPIKNGDDWLFGNGLAGILWPFTYWIDDQSQSSKEQWASYKRTTQSVAGSPDPGHVYASQYRGNTMDYAQQKCNGKDLIGSGPDYYNPKEE